MKRLAFVVVLAAGLHKKMKIGEELVEIDFEEETVKQEKKKPAPISYEQLDSEDTQNLSGFEDMLQSAETLV